MSNDSGNRQCKTEHNKKNVLFAIVCAWVFVCACERDRINQGRTREKERKKRVISATTTTATTAGASSDVPQ
jgi:hypothetical protein